MKVAKTIGMIRTLVLCMILADVSCRLSTFSPSSADGKFT